MWGESGTQTTTSVFYCWILLYEDHCDSAIQLWLFYCGLKFKNNLRHLLLFGVLLGEC